MALPYPLLSDLSREWLAGDTCAQIGAKRGISPQRAATLIANQRKEFPALFPPRLTSKTRAPSHARILRAMVAAQTTYGIGELYYRQVVSALAASVAAKKEARKKALYSRPGLE